MALRLASLEIFERVFNKHDLHIVNPLVGVLPHLHFIPGASCSIGSKQCGHWIGSDPSSSMSKGSRQCLQLSMSLRLAFILVPP